MLYSNGDKCWKLADFGTTTEATSKNLNTTRNGRGTAGYRAPEILADDARFNNKADIWALGCVVYELCTGERVFTSDWSVLQYPLSSDLKLPAPWPSDSQRRLSYLLFLQAKFQAMLQLDPSQRPRAIDLYWAWSLALKDTKICCPRAATDDSDDLDADGLSHTSLHGLTPSEDSLRVDTIQGWLQDVSDRPSEEGMWGIEEVNEMSTSDDVANQD